MASAPARLMLDTNAVSALLKGLSPQLNAWALEQRCYLSSIVVAEIRCGLEKLPPSSRLSGLVEEAMEILEILPWTDGCALVTADQAFAKVAALQLVAW
jgi:tRNA(fMet)-specific endonuclease VapC